LHIKSRRLPTNNKIINETRPILIDVNKAGAIAIPRIEKILTAANSRIPQPFGVMGRLAKKLTTIQALITIEKGKVGLKVKIMIANAPGTNIQPKMLQRLVPKKYKLFLNVIVD
jgi:hypothetical protein